MNKMTIRSVGMLLAVGVIAGLSGCSIYREDRCWVPEDQYLDARQMYITTGSLDLVVQQLEGMEWQRCKINEIRYRLEKEFDVLPEEKPKMTEVDPVELTPGAEIVVPAGK